MGLKAPVTGLAVVALLSTAAVVHAAATPLYQWNFDGQSVSNLTNGIVTPTVSSGGGTLQMHEIQYLLNPATNNYEPANVATSKYTSAGGGVSGSASDYGIVGSANGNTFYGNGSGASNTVANTLTGLGTLSQVTITGWIKPTTAALTGGSNPVLAQFAASTGYNSFNAGAGMAFLLNNGGLSFEANSGHQATAAVSLIANQWNFVAVRYDGLGAAYSSDPANATTVDTNGHNVEFFAGTTALASANVGNAIATDSSYGTTPGPVVLGNAAYASLISSEDLSRGLAGNGDDFRIYSGLLTESNIEAVRQSGLSATPEPASVAVLSIGSGVLLLRRRVVA